eukprot:TRINITY_DN11027_c0_g1_i1.p2 TRINITY_DN11027_c0_g1~~TRINITY_DN11027_c0_g1_i1.p2  ORF type:complete len:108 (-),score=2.72 TRINITY_DN11027_c0_g1_i1:89-412(-)
MVERQSKTNGSSCNTKFPIVASCLGRIRIQRAVSSFIARWKKNSSKSNLAMYWPLARPTTCSTSLQDACLKRGVVVHSLSTRRSVTIRTLLLSFLGTANVGVHVWPL